MNNEPLIKEFTKLIEEINTSLDHLDNEKISIKDLFNCYWERGRLYREIKEENTGFYDSKYRLRSIADFSKVIDIAEKFDIKNDNYHWSLIYRALYYQNCSQYENAIKDYTKLIALGHDYFINLAECYLEIKDLKKAHVYYEKALKNNPKINENYLNDDDWLVIFNWGCFLEYIKEYDMANVFFTKLIEKDPQDCVFYKCKAGIYKKMNRYKEAEDVLVQGIKVTNHFFLYEELARYYYEKGNKEAAENVLEEAESSSNVLWSEIIDLYEKNDNFKKSENRYSKWIKTDVECLYFRGKFYKKNKEYKKAEADFLKYLELLNQNSKEKKDEYIDNFSIYNELAKLYIEQKQYDKAEKYCNMIDDDYFVHKLRGYIRMLKGDLNGAQIDYQKTLGKIVVKGIERKIQDLSNLAETLTINCVDILKIDNLTKSAIPSYLKNYKDKQMIYLIKSNKLPKKYIDKIKDIKKEFAMARINEENIAYTDTIGYERLIDIRLYVGSSHNIYKRLLEHLGFGAKKTYALHLNKWWNKEPIQIEIYEVFNNKNNILQINSLQIIEDILWSQNKPLFGRQGQR